MMKFIGTGPNKNLQSHRQITSMTKCDVLFKHHKHMFMFLAFLHGLKMSLIFFILLLCHIDFAGGFFLLSHDSKASSQDRHQIAMWPTMQDKQTAGPVR